jgi:NAD(P)H-hydrate epimerase
MSPQESRVLDRNSEFYGVSLETLMENAGVAVAAALRRRFPSAKTIVFHCGPGNNGGDGLVAARLLRKAGVDARVVLADGAVRSRLAAAQLALANGAGVPVSSLADGAPPKADVVVDALLGTGAAGPLKEEIARAVRTVNESGAPVVAIDVPTGYAGSPAVRATLTIALHAPKSGVPQHLAGEVEVADIGIPADAARKTGPGEMELYPVPRREAHKGETGRLLVIAGGPYHGAPALAGLAAYRTGCDLVHIAAPKPCGDRISAYSASFIMHDLPGEILVPEHAPAVLEVVRGMHAVLIGPGLGRDPKSFEAAASIIQQTTCPLVLDAEALQVAASRPGLLKGKRILMTPHRGELRVLLNGLGIHREADVFGATAVAKELGASLLLKGPVDYVTDGTATKENHFGNPGMTVGGTGDVLAGVCAALLSRGLSPFDAGRVGIYITTRAGDRVFARHSYGLMPHDIVDEVARLLGEELTASAR